MNNERILVMNKGWSPIAVTTVRRGMSLVFREHARIVHHETFEMFSWERWLDQRSSPLGDGEIVPSGFIRTVSLKIELPQVITLSSYNGVPSRQIPFSRRTLFKRDGYQCQYCGVRPGTGALTIDHVMPRSRGGATDWLNCVVSCVRCNVRKGARTPDEAGLILHRHPFRPNWVEDLLTGEDIPAAWEKFVKV